MNVELINYIRKCRGLNISDEECKKQLRSIGWQEKDISEAYAVVDAPSGAPPAIPPEVQGPARHVDFTEGTEPKKEPPKEVPKEAPREMLRETPKDPQELFHMEKPAPGNTMNTFKSKTPLIVLGVIAALVIMGGGYLASAKFVYHTWPFEETGNSELKSSDESSVAEQNLKAGFSRYSSDVYGISFDYPSDWKIKEFTAPSAEFVVVTIDPVAIPTEEEIEESHVFGRIAFALWPMTIAEFNELLADLSDNGEFRPVVDEYKPVSIGNLIGITAAHKSGGGSKVIEMEDYLFDLPKPISAGRKEMLSLLRIYYEKQLFPEEKSGTYDAVFKEVLESVRFIEATRAGELTKPKDAIVDISSLKTHRNDKYGFSIQIPTAWVVQYENDPKDFLDYGLRLAASKDMNSPVILITIGDFGAKFSAESDRYQYRGSILEDRMITVAGRQAYELLIDFGYGEVVRYIYFDDNGKTFGIEVVSDPWADTLIKTFKLF